MPKPVMNSRKLKFLQSIVGNDGADALAKAVERVSALELAILPRAITAWLEVMGGLGYEGYVPGTESKFIFSKSEDGFSGYIVLDGQVHVFEKASLFHVAGCMAVALGMDHERIGPLTKSEQLAKLGKGIDLLVKSRVVQAMAKTSWNVKQKRSNLTPQQASNRRVRYAQSIGLNPEPIPPGQFETPVPTGNTIPYRPSFPVEHEAAHAMMTPPGQNIGGYIKDLSTTDSSSVPASIRSAAKPSKNPNYNDPARVQAAQSGEAFQRHAIGQQEENIATQMEHGIDRRSGVKGQTSNNRTARELFNNSPHDTIPGYEVDQVVPGSPSRSEKRIPSPMIRAKAKEHQAKFDDGASFDAAGNVMGPRGINARINARANARAKLGKATLPSGGGNKAKLPGVAAQPIGPSAPTPPTSVQPTNQKQMPQGAAGMSTASPLPQVKTGTKPKTSMKVTKSQAGVKCPACNRPQFVQSQFRGCFCMSALAKSVKTTETNEGFTLTFGTDWDRDAIDTLVEAFQGK